jgi:hypothetical protein
VIEPLNGYSMKSITLFLALTAVSFSCMAQSGVYKRVDQDGHIIYTDIQVKGASEVDLPEITVLPAARSSGSSIVKRKVTLAGQQGVVDKQIDQAIDPVPGSRIVHQNSVDQTITQLSDHDRVQQIIEEMALYEDSIEALEIELYNLGGGY